MDAVKGKWGFYPCTYETYLKLKRIKKWYWETVYAAARYDRWHNKFPHNRKGAEPPKYCPFVGNRVWGSRGKNDLGNHIWGKIPNKIDQKLLDLFEQARMPVPAETDVKVFDSNQLQLIFDTYQKIENWFGESQKVA
jgi:hypothetical protein